MKNSKIAQKWREANPGHPGGYILIHKSQNVAGWSSVRPAAADWQPGIICVSTSGQEWIATGGNHLDGAEMWEPIAKEAK